MGFFTDLCKDLMAEQKQGLKLCQQFNHPAKPCDCLTGHREMTVSVQVNTCAPFAESVGFSFL